MMINSASAAPRHPMNNSMRPPVSNNRMSSHGNLNRSQMSNNPMAMRNKSLDIEMHGAYKNSRLTFNVATLVGCVVQVEVLNGKHYEGIFKTFSSELELVLECVHLIDPKQPDLVPSRERTIEKLIVSFKDLVAMNAVNADTRYGEAVAADSFTDTGISKAQVNGTVKEEDYRKLVQWDGGDTSETLLETTGTGWRAEDMFRRNEEKFGIKSSFDDNMDEYTTKLDKSDTPDFQKKRAEAEFYAAQIEENVSSQANTAVENGDDLLTEEEKFSSVRRGTQRGSSPPKTDNSDQPQRYIPPAQRGHPSLPHQQRANSGNQFSQSARFTRDGPRKDSDKRNKTVQQPTGKVQDLKNWNSNFKMNTQSDSSSSSKAENRSPPKTNRKPSHNMENVGGSRTLPSTQPPASVVKPPQQAAAQVTEDVVTKVEVAATASAPAPPQVSSPRANPSVDTVSQDSSNIPPDEHSSAAAAASSTTGAAALSTAGAAAVSSTTGAAAASSTTGTAAASSTSGAAEVKPAVTTAVESKLNPEAKEFVFSPKPPVVPAPLSQPQPLMHPPPPHPHPHTQLFTKSKTATVSVEAARQPTRPAEMPTPAQAMGPPITMNQMNPAVTAAHHQQFLSQMVVPSPYGSHRLHRVPSYPGSEGQPGQAHLIQAQPMLHPSFFPNTMTGHVIPMQSQAQASMAVPHPHNAQIHQAQHQPPAVMNSGNPPSAAAQHQVHPSQHFPNHGANPNYMYAAVPQPGGQQNQPAQPPLQPSPHNPSPSPVNNGGPVVSYHNYAPPQSQQFYPQAQMGAAAAHPPPQAYHQPPQPVIYLSGQYAHQHLPPSYHNPRLPGPPQAGTGYATNYPQQQQ